MEPKLAAGILLYRLQRTPEFLLIHDSYSQRRHWTPPKGFFFLSFIISFFSVDIEGPSVCDRQVIGKEDELKCALRHTTELTGLQAKDVIIEEGHSYQIK
jgi:hypothetical protein